MSKVKEKLNSKSDSEDKCTTKEKQSCSEQPIETTKGVSISSVYKLKRSKKVCRVCGDKALGYNFNVITCESCKAFFRRNAFKEKDIKCLFENKCLVDVRTRRFCPSCRIKKCFQVGMQRQMILDDRRKRRHLNRLSQSELKNETKLCNCECGCKTNSTEMEKLLQMKQERLEENSVSIDAPSGATTQQTPNPKTPSSNDNQSENSDLFVHPSLEDIFSQSNMFYALMPQEKEDLDLISNAYGKTLGAVPSLGPYSNENQYNTAADLINQSEIAMRKLIEFVKHLSVFNCLEKADQISLLKSCGMNTLLLRSALFYDIEKNAWNTGNSALSSNILKKATGVVELYHRHISYCRMVKSMAHTDLNWYALLQMLLMFDPGSPNISDRKYVSSIQEKYLILLKRYLESRYSYMFAKEYFVSSLDRMGDLKLLSEVHAKIFMQLQSSEVEPLMMEMFNLK